MLYTLQNSAVTATVDSLGAQLTSLTGADGTEYLWNGDAAFWSSRSPLLFPYVGRLTDGHYTYRGQSYALPIHGFARSMDFQVISAASEQLLLRLTHTPETLDHYPFPFALTVTYTLAGAALCISYTVENTGGEAMFFGLGGHPGFRVPLEVGKSFTDYRLTFAQPCRPDQVLLSPRYMIGGSTAPFPLENGDALPLTHGLFDDDAIILQHMDKTVTLSAGPGSRGVTLSLPQMRYLGIWHTPHSEAPFVCLEPWVSLPSRDGVVEDFSQQADLVRLEGGAIYQNRWSITIF